MDYATAASTRPRVETIYLPPLIFILPITKEDFSKQGEIHKIFLEISQPIRLALPEESQSKIVIQKTVHGMKKVKSVKIYLLTSCQNQQEEILAERMEVRDTKVFPLRDDQNHKFYPRSVGVKIKNILPNVLA